MNVRSHQFLRSDRTSAIKTTVLGTLLLALLVWPLAHRGAVHFLGVHPWKFMGFAMYSTPREVALELWNMSYDPVPVRLSHLSAESHRELRGFMDQHAIWGTLVRPDRLGRSVLAEVKAIDQLYIYVGIRSLSAEGQMKSRWRTYVYHQRKQESHAKVHAGADAGSR